MVGPTLAEDDTPDFEPRNPPRQGRAVRTIESILTATAELLEENGFEQLSTNQICKRACITPPALYHYFPNKYAIMYELAERLFKAQTDVMKKWDQDHTKIADVDDIMVMMRTLLTSLRSQLAGPWMMRSMHASPRLAGLGQKLLTNTALLITDRSLRLDPTLDRDLIYTRARIGVAMASAVVDTIFDDPTLDEDVVLRMGAEAIHSNWKLALAGA